jgi:hypothetical protein
MLFRILGFTFIVTFLILSCQSDKAEADAQSAETRHAVRAVVVFGIDDTGSYGLWEQAKSIACRVVDQLQPGDILNCRRITDSSYLDTCLILKLAMPLIEELGNNNPFDRKAKRVMRQQDSGIKALKREACNRLSGLRSTNSKRTDIYGFVAAAADRFALAPKEHKRILILASDLEDNVGYQPKMNLAGAQVAVLGFQSSKDPVKTQRVKQSWTKRFTEAGATRIVFLPLEEKFNLDQFKGD